jgi:putative Mg2+ transporter-C (MgtC) family protein
VDWVNQLQLLGHVALAGLLGGLIGAERERAHKPAGLRTHILVAAAAALLVQLGYLGISHLGPAALPDGGDHQPIRADPIRIMQAIILGISFLGAGTILRERDARVEGLTTAATILLTATVGITTALRQYLLAAGVTLLTLLVLTALGWLERRSRR